MQKMRGYAWKNALVSGLLLLPLLFVTQTHASGLQTATSDGELLVSHVEKISAFSGPPATESEFAAGVYIENTLRSYGYETELLPLPYYTYRKPDVQSLVVEGWHEQQWKLQGFKYAPNGKAEGAIVNCGIGAAEDYQRVDVSGKIALVERGGLSYGEKVRQAAAAGAVALLIQNDRDVFGQTTLEAPLDMAVPVLGISKSQGEQLRKRMQSNGELKASLRVEGALTIRQTSYSFIGKMPATTASRNQAVLLGTRHDIVRGSSDVDQASTGAAVMLEAARLLADRPRDTDLYVVSFGASMAEDQGVRAFVDLLEPKEKQRIIAAFVLDRLGSEKDGDVLVTPGDGSGRESLPVRLAQKFGAQYAPSLEQRARLSRTDQILAYAGIPTALLTRQYESRVTPPSIPSRNIKPEPLIQVTDLLVQAAGEIIDPTTAAYPVEGGTAQPAGKTPYDVEETQ